MTATVTREAPAAGSAADPKAAAKGGKAEKKSLLKSKKAIIAVVALLGVGGGAYKMLMPTKVGPPTGGDIVSMDPTTVNLAGGHYLQIAVAIQLVKGKASATDFQSSHAAELVINEFSGLQAAQVQRPAIRQKLHDQLEASLKKAYPDEVCNMFLVKYVTQ